MAVKCGLRIIELAAASKAAAGGPIPVGVGVHAGETVATDEGFVGSAVNVAARVCGQARAGELLVTDAVRSLTRTYLEVAFRPLGRRRLKGISEPIRLYRVTPGRVLAAVPAWQRIGRNRPLVAAAVAIPLVLVIALISGALMRQGTAEPRAGNSSSPGVSTPPMEASVAATASASAGVPDFPTPEEAALVELIPSEYRESCQRADPDERPIIMVVPPGEEPPPGQPRIIRAVVAAGIDCDLGGIAAPDRVLYWDVIPNLPEDGDNAQVALARHGGIVGATPGGCREEQPAFEAFSFGGTSGTLVCYETDEGDAVLLWVFDDAQLFGKAVREDRDVAALLDWWDEVGRFAVP
jgi:hypothetical protein